jgi:hypothetical protein
MLLTVRYMLWYAVRKILWYVTQQYVLITYYYVNLPRSLHVTYHSRCTYHIDCPRMTLTLTHHTFTFPHLAAKTATTTTTTTSTTTANTSTTTTTTTYEPRHRITTPALT